MGNEENASTIPVAETGKLGFGLMRLPKKGLGTDIKQTSEMVDMFLDAGFTYFDTAFVYPGSEEAIRKALVERVPRDRYTLATKIMATAVPTEKLVKKELDTSLERTGAGYIDYYLLHALMDDNYEKYEKFHLWDFVKEEKEKGRIRHYGFSFHGTPALLDKLLTEHPDAEFVQLQINYADWENPGVRSRECYEIARKHGKPIVVMEPVKGGKLADPPKEVKEIFDKVNPGASYASWAIRFVASLDGILTVLSGMSNTDQMADNLSYMREFKPLNDEEMAAVHEAQKVFYESKSIPCTACRYCVAGCPMSIPIPDIFAARNIQLESGRITAAREAYEAAVSGDAGRAADCIACRQCEGACPQHLPIVSLLEECAAAYDA